MSLRSNQDQQKSHTVICFNFFFSFSWLNVCDVYIVSFPIFAVGTAGRAAQYQTFQAGRLTDGQRVHRPSRPIGPRGQRRTTGSFASQ